MSKDERREAREKLCERVALCLHLNNPNAEKFFLRMAKSILSTRERKFIPSWSSDQKAICHHPFGSYLRLAVLRNVRKTIVLQQACCRSHGWQCRAGGTGLICFLLSDQ
jgi:hypothetical protein